MTAPLPVANAVGTLIGSLIGARPKVAKAATPVVPGRTHSVATYIDVEKKIVYAAVADVAFVASAGAALAMIPAGVVAEAVKTGRPSDAMYENTYEVLNIGASLFNEIEDTPLHVKIEKLAPMAQVPAAVAARLAKPTARLDLSVTLPGYPEGRLSLLALG
jgi:hypothetical protein